MALENEVTLTVLKLATVALGGVFLWFAGRAWLKHRDCRMAALFVAMVLMTAAALSEGIAYRGIGLALDTSHLIEAIVMLAAFAVLVYSLFTRNRRMP